MSLVILGQSGGPTKLSANDDQFGLMTQDPTGAVKHSDDGLTAANAGTAYGQPFTLVVHLTTSNPEGGDTTLSKALTSSDAPYKFRVLRVKVTMLDEANGRLREAANSCHIAVLAGNDSVAAGDVSDLKQLDERSLSLSRTGGEVIAASGSLSVTARVRLGETGTTDTLSLLVELSCIRVV